MQLAKKSRLWHALAVLALAGLLTVAVGVVVRRGVQEAREAARHAACRSRLYGIGVTLRNYDLHGTYPPAGDELATDGAAVSWRVAVLRANGGNRERALDGYDVSQPWNSAHNEQFALPRIASRYCCPSDGDAERTGRTSYLAVVGEGTVWSEVRMGHILNPAEEVPDKIVVIEVPHSDVHWMEPRDISAEEAIALYRREDGFRSGRHRRGLNFLTAAGHAYRFQEIDSVEEFASRLFVHRDSPEGDEPDACESRESLDDQP